MPRIPYDVFMVDPPWPKKKGGLRAARPNQGRELNYDTLDVASCFELLDREIFSLAVNTHSVFLWTVDEFLWAAETQMGNRGYRRHARMIWSKLNGVAPAFTVRFAHEYLIWFYKPKMIPVAKAVRGKFTTIIEERAREHSRKPEAAYALVEALYPLARRLDVFSRQNRAGWDAWGNEVGKFNEYRN